MCTHERTHAALLSISHSHTTHVHVYTLTYTFTQITHTHFLIPNTHTPQLLAEFDGLFAGHRARVGDAAAAAAAAAGGAPALPSVGGGRGDEPVIDMTHTQTAMTALKIFVHCADISNPCKPWNIYAKWTERVVAEFRRQAAMEIENGLALQGTASYRSTLEESFVLSRMQVRTVLFSLSSLSLPSSSSSRTVCSAKHPHAHLLSPNQTTNSLGSLTTL